jgi:hypothetical protein
MQDINRIVIDRNNHESQEEFENAIRDAVMLLMNEGYVMVVRYDEPGLGIVCIDFDHDDLCMGSPYPYWLTSGQCESVAFDDEK